MGMQVKSLPRISPFGRKKRLYLHNLENVNIVYPNPFVDSLNVSFEDEPDQNINASIYTISGILVSSQVLSIENGRLTIDISILSSGMYYLKLDSESIHAAFKIIKK